MIKPGFESTDPFTGTRIRLVKGTEETQGRGWEIEVRCPEGARPWVLEHVHTTWTETFEILQGSAAYRLGGESKALEAGQSVTMPANVNHIHPWNAGSGEMVCRQINDFGAEDPTAVDDVLGAFATVHGLAREGRIGKRGLPKNPLQFGATLRTLTRHGGYDAAVPIPVQQVLAATLGRLAEALGYRGVYLRYLVR